jgi:hypothetical protein
MSKLIKTIKTSLRTGANKPEFFKKVVPGIKMIGLRS